MYRGLRHSSTYYSHRLVVNTYLYDYMCTYKLYAGLHISDRLAIYILCVRKISSGYIPLLYYNVPGNLLIEDTDSKT